MKIREIMEFLKGHSEIKDWVAFTRRNWSPFDEKISN
jgi:hypothetical protein